MKFTYIALAAVALGLGTATAAHAGATRYYLATFTAPGANFQHCFALTTTNQYPGYATSGTWTDTDFPNTAGTYVVTHHTLHLAGYVSNGSATPDVLTVDGPLSSGTLTSATFDYFTVNGIYYAAGSLSEKIDAACK
jgi:hypothetical protein